MDECDGACEKVNFAHTVLSKADSSPPMKEKMAELETTEVSGQADSSKGHQGHQDLSTMVQEENDLPCICSGNPAGIQNTDKKEEHPQKHVSQKSADSANKFSRLSAPSREEGPSTSKSGGEVIRTR